MQQDNSHALQTMPTETPRIAAALDKTRALLTPGETIIAYAVQRRLFSLTRRRALVVATSGRLLFIQRGFFGGFTLFDIRWQDLVATEIKEGIFSSTLCVEATPVTVAIKAIDDGGKRVASLGGLRKVEAQRVYVVCQTEEQAWREKNRVRELEELRAKSGGLQLGAAGLNAPVGGQDSIARLQQAKELLDKKLISDAEYEALKAKVVAGL